MGVRWRDSEKHHLFLKVINEATSKGYTWPLTTVEFRRLLKRAQDEGLPYDRRRDSLSGVTLDNLRPELEALYADLTARRERDKFPKFPQPPTTDAPAWTRLWPMS